MDFMYHDPEKVFPLLPSEQIQRIIAGRRMLPKRPAASKHQIFAVHLFLNEELSVPSGDVVCARDQPEKLKLSAAADNPNLFWQKRNSLARVAAPSPPKSLNKCGAL
jgi:hypothetical protein